MYIKDVLDHLKFTNKFTTIIQSLDLKGRFLSWIQFSLLCRDSNRGPMYLAAGRRANH